MKTDIVEVIQYIQQTMTTLANYGKKNKRTEELKFRPVWNVINISYIFTLKQEPCTLYKHSFVKFCTNTNQLEY